MGFFSPKTTAKTDMTTMPVYDDAIKQPLYDAFGRVNGLGQGDPSALVAPASGAQNAANSRALGLGGSSLFGEAAGATRGAMGGGLLDEAAAGTRSFMGASPIFGGGAPSAGSGTWSAFDKFMNPYTSEVLDTGLQRLNREGDRSVQGAKLAMAGPNHGDNAHVLEALTRGEIQSGINDFTSSTLFGAADRAAGFADKQADRDQQISMFNAQMAAQEKQQQMAERGLGLSAAGQLASIGGQQGGLNLNAAGQLANIGGMQGSSDRADVGTLLDVGGTMRDIDSAQRRAPFDQAQWQNQQYSLLNPGAFSGQHQTGTTTSKTSGGLGSTLLGGLGSIAMGGGALGWKPFS